MRLIINKIDFTECIQEKSYKIDEQPVYTKWTDANGRDHRDITRKRVSGTFDMVFVEGMHKTYTEFKNAIKAAENDGVLTATIGINNTDEERKIECFYTIKFSPPQKISEERTFRKCSINIEEC